MTSSVGRLFGLGLLVVVVGCGNRLPSAGSGPLRLELRAERERYSLDDARSGRVVLFATFENTGTAEVRVGHPISCIPREPRPGESIPRDPQASALLLSLESPSGTLTTLRYGTTFFQPGGRDHLMLAAGGSDEIRLARLGPEFAEAHWEDLQRPLFEERGVYRLRVRYRNTLPLAIINPGDGASTLPVWVGELSSDVVELLVQ